MCLKNAQEDLKEKEEEVASLRRAIDIGNKFK